MKKILAFSALCLTLFVGTVQAQDKSTRPSPPAKVTQTLSSGATVSIEYSQPSVKGRTIGKDLEPMKNKVWRMGANEATVFESDRDLTIEGKTLQEGRYSMFGVWEDSGFRIIFNSATGIWGTQYEKNRDKDVMSFTVQPRTTTTSQEQLTYTIDKSGKVTLLWGTMAVDFMIK